MFFLPCLQSRLPSAPSSTARLSNERFAGERANVVPLLNVASFSVVSLRQRKTSSPRSLRFCRGVERKPAPLVRVGAPALKCCAPCPAKGIIHLGVLFAVPVALGASEDPASGSPGYQFPHRGLTRRSKGRAVNVTLRSFRRGARPLAFVRYRAKISLAHLAG